MPAAVGRAQAMRLALLSDVVAAPEALAVGLVSHVLPDADYDAGLAKIVAGYHQYHAVNRAIDSTIRAADPRLGVAEEPANYGLPSVRDQKQGDRRAGVIWRLWNRIVR